MGHSPKICDVTTVQFPDGNVLKLSQHFTLFLNFFFQTILLDLGMLGLR